MDEDEYQYVQEDYGYGDYSDEQVPKDYDQPSYSQEEQMMIEEKDYEIFPLSKMFMELNEILQQIQNLVYISKGWCLLLLKQFKWDKDYLKEQYYNNNELYLKRIGFQQGLEDPSNFSRGVLGDVCQVCYSENIPIYYNICSHKYCLDCWISHIKQSISSSAFPRCMDMDCLCPLLLETVTGLLKLYSTEGESLLNKYEKKLCQMFITTNRNYQFCTGIDCGYCIKVNTQIETVTCKCGKVFCFKCQSDDHYPCNCDEKAKWIEQVMKQQADSKWISQNAKICPWCKKAVERSMGCNFMACTCGKSFCYMCSQPWQPDHKDHFKCHIFKKKPEDQANRQKEILERMNHSTERYIFNQAVANNYKEIDVFAKRKYLFKTLKIDLTESEFMENAYHFAIQCCQKLKWIYAFTYFKDIKTRKETFEFSLGEYQKYKENLLKYLAADLKMFMTEIEKTETLGQKQIDQLRQKFKHLKKLIVNYYTCTKNYKEKFVIELQKMTEEMHQEKEKIELEKYQQDHPQLKKKVTPEITRTTSKNGEESEKQDKGGFLNAIIGGKKKPKKGK